jgi:hypothetical protein
MTRRQRLETIINGADERSFRYERDGLICKLGLAAFTDDAIETLARTLVRSHIWDQKMNKRNRAINAAQETDAA